MCGRYTLTSDFFNLRLHYSTDLVEERLLREPWRPRYNIAPGQLLPVVIESDGKALIRLMKWGLVPFWSKDEKTGYKMINARSETVEEKPSFRKAFAERRCLIPADGFYEWKKGKSPKDTKIPMWIHRKDRQLFSFAGLWDVWKGTPDNPLSEPLYTFTVLTTEASPLVASVHDRMPVILTPEQERIWLSPARDTRTRQALRELLKPYRELQIAEVSTLVNSPKNDGPECLEPVEK